MRPLRLVLIVVLLGTALPAGVASAAPDCPCSIHAAADAPVGGQVRAAEPVEVGMRFAADVDGYVTALRFYRQPGDGGVHVGHLWAASGELLAAAPFAGETPSGWQEAPLAAPVAVRAGAVHVVSYHAESGAFTATPGLFEHLGAPGPVHAVPGGDAGVQARGREGVFPDTPSGGAGHWVDVVFEPVPAAGTAPRVASTAPLDGATAVAPDADVQLRFAAPVNGATIGPDTVTLDAQDAGPVPAVVTYDDAAHAATLRPLAPLARGRSFTATVRGGPGGVTGPDGVALAASRSWTFTTAAACPCTAFADDDRPSATSAVRRDPAELGVRLVAGEDGFITALRRFRQPNDRGEHAGHLWSGSGQLLATTAFTSAKPGWETAELPASVPVGAGATYVASYYADDGRRTEQRSFFAAPTPGSVLRAPADWAAGGNGVLAVGDSRFPQASLGAANFWVDAVFERAVAADAPAAPVPPQPAAPEVAAVTAAGDASGSVRLGPAGARTDATLTAMPRGFDLPAGAAPGYEFAWSRNGTPIAGATSDTLDLLAPGAGGAGDTISVRVHPRSAPDDEATASLVVANSRPVPGAVTVTPAEPGLGDRLTALVGRFSDPDEDGLGYRYAWRRNGDRIAGADERSLDLGAVAGVRPGDQLTVDVQAVDGRGGETALATGGARITTGGPTPVAAYGFEEAAGDGLGDAAGDSDGLLGAAARSDQGRFGRGLALAGAGDPAQVVDAPALRVSGALTVEAWVRPERAGDWLPVVAKAGPDGPAWALYAAAGEDGAAAVATVGGARLLATAPALPAGVWSHLAATYDGARVQLYVDGRAVATVPAPGALASGRGPLLLGTDGSADHALRGQVDELRVYDRALTPAQVAADRDRPVIDGTPPPPQSTDPALIGRMEPATAWPHAPVSVALLSDGRVLSWDGLGVAEPARLWDPARGGFTTAAGGPGVCCGAVVGDGSGRLLVLGGGDSGSAGSAEVHAFDPRAGTWTRLADMTRARRRASAVALPDGRVLALSGDAVRTTGADAAAGSIADPTVPELYDPVADAWTPLPAAARPMPLSPSAMVLPDGRVLDAGPDRTTRTLDLATGRWTVVGDSGLDGQGAVQYLPGRVLKAGTRSEPGLPARAAGHGAATIDLTASRPVWKPTAPMNYPRAYNDLTLLPDGSVLASGGQATSDGVDARTGVLPLERWDPATGTWTVLASTARAHLYHGAATLLPDGEVLLSGGQPRGTAADAISAERYAPPYLFAGPRPRISAAPATLPYGGRFTVATPDRARIVSASLVRVRAGGEGPDGNQRFVPLAVRDLDGTLSLDGPAGPAQAPPGTYLLFLLDADGVPSVGRTVLVGAATPPPPPPPPPPSPPPAGGGGADTTPPAAPATLTATTGSGGAVLRWAAATDDVGVVAYHVFRSATPGFDAAAATELAVVRSGLTYTDTGAGAETFYYRVRAVDAAGNTGAPSPEARAGAAPTPPAGGGGGGAAGDVRLEGVTSGEAYHSPQSPGYTAWLGAWPSADGRSLFASFVQVTGPVAPLKRPTDPVWPGVDLASVIIRSDDAGKTWQRVRSDPFKGVPHAYSGQATVGLADGTILRRVNAEDLRAVGVPERGTAYIQRLAPGAKTWSAPQYLMDPARYTYQLSRIQRLRDGRLLASGNYWEVPAGTRNGPVPLERQGWLLMTSSDDGRTWKDALDAPTAPPPNEWDLAEVGDDLLAVMRTYDPADPRVPVRRQAVLRKAGDGWRMGPATATPFPHSGHPELLSTKEGVVLHIATTGTHWTNDLGQTWHPLPYKSWYYPTSFQTPDGVIHVFSHRGGDDDYGETDQAVMASTFRLRVTP